MIFLSKVRDSIARQSKEFQKGHDAIRQVNSTTLKSATIIVALVTTVVFALSFVLPTLFDVRLTYGLMWVFLCLFVVVVLSILRDNKEPRPCLYLLFSFLFLFTIYMSVVVSPAYRATIFLGLIPVVPLLIVDQSWRLNLYLAAVVLFHSCLSFLYKSGEIPVEDSLNGLILLVMGLYVGASVRRTRLDNFELQRQTAVLSEVDFLTGLHNRRKTYELMSQSSDGDRLIQGVLLLDVDCFKQYNDQHGHQAGDDCLSQIGLFLKSFAAKYGIEMVRFGGEEFIGFCYQEEGELAPVAEALRQGIYDLNIPFPSQDTGRISVSVGVFQAQAGVTLSPHQMISAADQALYCAKNNGRNCCAISPPPKDAASPK